ncbi:DUF6461 domain-containing protein [Nonomuraea recticatena]|uniref:DUF6461 domain-containing protein n=1 Tax=Nonomuraea recticatena TaxID=46178 RepID=UPI003D1565A7
MSPPATRKGRRSTAPPYQLHGGRHPPQPCRLRVRRRLAASPVSALPGFESRPPGACTARGGTVLIEYGWGGIVHNKSDILSEGSSAAAVHVTINRADFAYYEDGRLITTFGLSSYRYREGTDPDRLAADVVELGMVIDGDEPGFVEPTSAALALAERATGVHLTRGYGRTALVGSTAQPLTL